MCHNRTDPTQSITNRLLRHLLLAQGGPFHRVSAGVPTCSVKVRIIVDPRDMMCIPLSGLARSICALMIDIL